jgi:hypothetical protein
VVVVVVPALVVLLLLLLLPVLAVTLLPFHAATTALEAPTCLLLCVVWLTPVSHTVSTMACTTSSRCLGMLIRVMLAGVTELSWYVVLETWSLSLVL